jgi:PTS system nitrogen regulatory IIA component
MHLNLIQVAESLGVEESVVLAWVRHEGLPCVHDTGRMLFDRSEVAGWATERGLAAKAGFLASSAGAGAAEENEIQKMLRRGGIWRAVAPSSARETIARVLMNMPGVSQEIRQMLAQRAIVPDAITWAPIGQGFALPHLRSRVALGRDAGLVALLILARPLEFAEDTPDGIPVTRLLFFLAPTPRAHLEILAKLSTAVSRGIFAERVNAGASDEQILSALNQPGGNSVEAAQ